MPMLCISPPAPAGPFRRSKTDKQVLPNSHVDEARLPSEAESFPGGQLPLDVTCFAS